MSLTAAGDKKSTFESVSDALFHNLWILCSCLGFIEIYECPYIANPCSSLRFSLKFVIQSSLASFEFDMGSFNHRFQQ